jgi:hypothetical protein
MAETTTQEAPRVPVVAGTTLTFDVLRWDEGWDFDCPVCVLRPVLRFSPNGEHADQIVDDLCVDAITDGYLTSEDTEDGLIDRQYPLASLKQRWAAAWRGKEFPVRQYTASRFVARFMDDPHEPGELTFEIVEQENSNG